MSAKEDNMIEHQNVNTFQVGNEKFYPMMLPKDGMTKEEQVECFKRALLQASTDPEKGVLHYCEIGDTYGIVFLPDAGAKSIELISCEDATPEEEEEGPE